MKELNKKAFDNGYQYDDHKKQLKKETKHRQKQREQKRNWN